MIGQEERDAVLRVMDRGVLSGYQGNWSDAFYGGPEVREMEREWAEYFGVKHAITCNSATSGLWLACAAIGLQWHRIPEEKGSAVQYIPDEVICTPYSMTCSATIPLHFGAKPVFADIERDYYCLDPKDVEAKITPNTKAIIVVDIFGQPYDADAINAIAKKHGLYVIEDAAQAIGAKYKGKYAGTLGDIGVFSLNVHKHIQCGEGGVVVTNDSDLAFRLRLVMNHAEAVMNGMPENCGILIDGGETTWVHNYYDLVGMNLRMTELQAAIAREQLKKLNGILEIVRENAKYFPVKVRPECEHAHYRYAIIDQEFKTDFEAGAWMNNERFNSKPHYITPLYKMPLFRSLGYAQDLCPVCEEVEENIVLAWLKEVV